MPRPAEWVTALKAWQGQNGPSHETMLTEPLPGTAGIWATSAGRTRREAIVAAAKEERQDTLVLGCRRILANLPNVIGG